MAAIVGCLCNSRLVVPGAGEGPDWPVLMLWGAQIAAFAALAVFFLVRRRAGHPTPVVPGFAEEDDPRD